MDLEKVAEKARTVAKDAAQAASKVSETVQAEYHRTFVELDCKIVRISDELMIMEFPEQDTVNRLSTRLNTDFPNRLLIYNLSEVKYDTSVFLGEVVDVDFAGLPMPPFHKLVELCLAAHQWLVADTNNVLVVHCHKGYARSASFMSCLMAFRGIVTTPMDALVDVCKKLEIDEGSEVLPNQRQYLNYFHQWQQGCTPTAVRKKLLEVKLNGVPCFEPNETVAFRPQIEVWSNGEGCYCSASQGAAALPELLAIDSSASLPLGPDALMFADTFVKLHHVRSNGRNELAFTALFHTAFVDDTLCFAKTQLNVACTDKRVPDEFTAEFIFESGRDSDSTSSLPVVFDKAREVSKRFRDEQERKRAAADKEKPDEGDELERTLLRGEHRASDSQSSSSRAAAATSDGSDALSKIQVPQESDVELRRQLAAAAADDEALHAAGKVGDDGGATSASVAQRSQTVEDIVTGSENEIDELFGQFDAALDSLGTSTPKISGTAAAKSTPTVQSASRDEDGFDETEAFLKELEGAATSTDAPG